MSQFEIPFKLENSQYNEVLMLEKRGDDYGIVLAQESKEGTNYKRWVFPQRRVDNKNVPAEKAIPLRVPLGNRDQAVRILTAMLNVFAPKPKDDIPF